MQQILIFGLIILTVMLNAGAQTLLKLGSGQALLNLYLLAGIGLYGISTMFYILVLGKFNLSVAYPVVIGLTIIATTIASGIILREKILISQWIGVGLLISGIWAITLNKSI